MTSILSRIRQWFAPTALVAASWFVLDHLLPDLLPKPPHAVGVSIALIAAATAIVAIGARGWTLLTERMPQPWFPRPVWRVRTRLKRRASVSIITDFPKVAFGDGTMEACAFSLTLQRNLARIETQSILELGSAQLVLTQTIGRKTHRHVFRPRDAGGFLALPIARGTSDAVVIEFVGTRYPAPISEAPDFARDYRLELRGVFVRVKGRRGFIAELPVASWIWCQHYSRPVDLNLVGAAASAW